MKAAHTVPAAATAELSSSCGKKPCRKLKVSRGIETSSRQPMPERHVASSCFGVHAVAVEEAALSTLPSLSELPDMDELPLHSLLRQTSALGEDQQISSRFLQGSFISSLPSTPDTHIQSAGNEEPGGCQKVLAPGVTVVGSSQLASALTESSGRLSEVTSDATSAASAFPCSPVEHMHLRESGSVFGAVLQSETPPETKQENGLGDDYHVNVGYAIRTLREELPTLFYKEMSYNIYRDDITFQDPLNTFRGLKSYQTIFWALRFHGRIFFKALWVDVNRVWQPNDRTITIRWSVRGVPRVPWEAWGRFDGTSEYKLDKNGKIYSHKVDNVAMSDPPRYRPLTVVELLQLGSVQRTPGVTCFSCQGTYWGNQDGHGGAIRRGLAEGALSGAAAPLHVLQPYAVVEEADPVFAGKGLLALALGGLGSAPMSWFRFYLALTGTLALRDDLDFAARALLLA